MMIMHNLLRIQANTITVTCQLLFKDKIDTRKSETISEKLVYVSF